MKILSLSGFVPEQIADTVRFTQYNGTQHISHYCGYIADYISQVLEDSSVDGAAFPRTCDSCRVMPSYLADCRKFVYQLAAPTRQDNFAVEYFAESIRQYAAAIEKHYGVTLADIAERAEFVNKRNSKLRRLYSQLSELSYFEYLSAIHAMLQKPLFEQSVPSISGNVHGGKPVFVVGSFTNLNVVKAIETAGLNIVGDNLTESKRLFSAPPVSVGGNIYRNVAESILFNRLSPTQNDFANILKNDLAEIKDKAVKGVVFITQKYCEPYDYLFASYKKILDKNNIPALRLVLGSTTDSKRFELQIESLADMI